MAIPKRKFLKRSFVIIPVVWITLVIAGFGIVASLLVLEQLHPPGWNLRVYPKSEPIGDSQELDSASNIHYTNYYWTSDVPASVKNWFSQFAVPFVSDDLGLYRSIYWSSGEIKPSDDKKREPESEQNAFDNLKSWNCVFECVTVTLVDLSQIEVENFDYYKQLNASHLLHSGTLIMQEYYSSPSD